MKGVEDPLSPSKCTHFIFSVQGTTIPATPIQRGRGGLAEGEGGLAEGKGGLPGGGWLHSKVWTDAHMNATGF